MLTEKPQDIGMDSKSPAERDRIDLNHEVAGVETGRLKRFLPEGSAGYSGETKKKKSEREFRTLLEILLAEDPHYAALYTRVAEKLEKAGQAVDQALLGINQRLEASDRKLHYLRRQAAELEDGTKVFQSTEDGSVYTEGGESLSDENAQDIAFSDNAPSWEEYSAEKEAYDTAARQKQEVEDYQRNVLNPATERMENADDPPSMEELEELERRLETEMPDVVRTELHDKELSTQIAERSSTSAAHDIVNKTKLDVPEMGEAFDLARVDVPDLGPVPGIEPAPIKPPG